MYISGVHQGKTMMTVSIKEARENMKSLLDRVAAGEEIALLRRGREVARLIPPKTTRRRLPSLEAFRREVAVRGRPLSDDVVKGRREERY
jgi:prevent-host-death family protein